jgi:hypothetical protein
VPGKKNPALERGFFASWLDRRSTGGSHLGGLQTLGASFHFEIHRLTFGQGFEPTSLDGREVHEYIGAAIRGCDKTETLRIIEPLYGTCRHFDYLQKRLNALLIADLEKGEIQELPKRCC